MFFEEMSSALVMEHVPCVVLSSIGVSHCGPFQYRHAAHLIDESIVHSPVVGGACAPPWC
jgi:hypothetical protein